MEKILVTGSTGFIGGNLVQKLSLLDYEIHVIERYISRNTSNISYPKNVIRHSLNLYDYSVVHKLIKDLKPSYVINLAAISPVSYSYEHPLEVLENNFLASVNLAECCEKDDTELKQFITASTSEVYGLLLQDPDSKLTETGIIDKYGKETDLPPLPNSPYAVGKLSFDHYLKYMGMAYDFPYTIMRPFNTYGRLNNQHFFIENAIKQMMSNSDKIMLGEKGAIRDWMYVDDHVQAYLDVISNKQSRYNIFNFGTGVGYSVENTIQIISDILGWNGEIYWNTIPRRPVDARILISDSSKATRILGWKPKYDFITGIKKFITKIKE